MKPLLIILFLLNSSCFGQNHEFDVGFQVGVPVSNLNLGQPDVFTRYDIYEIESLYDIGLSLLYKYQIWKKQNLFLTAGLGFSRAKYNLPLNQDGTREIVANVLISNARFSIKVFGVEKKFAVYDNKLNINIGWSLVSQQLYLKDYQNYAEKNLPIENDLVKYSGRLTYDYNVDIYYNQLKNGPTSIEELYLNGEYYLQFQGNITNKLSLNLAINYYRNIVFYYNYNYTFLYDHGSSKSYYKNVGLVGYDDPNFGTRTHFLALKLSCSYKF